MKLKHWRLEVGCAAFERLLAAIVGSRLMRSEKTEEKLTPLFWSHLDKRCERSARKKLRSTVEARERKTCGPSTSARALSGNQPQSLRHVKTASRQKSGACTSGRVGHEWLECLTTPLKIPRHCNCGLHPRPLENTKVKERGLLKGFTHSLTRGDGGLSHFPTRLTCNEKGCIRNTATIQINQMFLFN